MEKPIRRNATKKVKKMKHLLLFDTAAGSDNLGDGIIMDYCKQQLRECLTERFFIYNIPTHLEIGSKGYQLNKKSDLNIVCGTNILKTSIIFNKGWRLYLKDILHLRNLCLMGAGWGNYNSYNSDPYTKWAYRTILSHNMLHSVRDEYTKKRLNSIGIMNVVNTACPTMWKLTPDFCRTIPTQKGRKVVTSLTCYKQNAELDKQMLNTLQAHYEKIFFWTQQDMDIEYLQSLGIGGKVIVLNPTLESYDQFLQDSNSLDYIGSRLHGGIRALNHGIRSLIIGVDNRATEIHRDTNLPFIPREQMDNLSQWITGSTATEISLPQANIDKWKRQFKQYYCE